MSRPQIPPTSKAEAAKTYTNPQSPQKETFSTTAHLLMRATRLPLSERHFDWQVLEHIVRRRRETRKKKKFFSAKKGRPPCPEFFINFKNSCRFGFAVKSWFQKAPTMKSNAPSTYIIKWFKRASKSRPYLLWRVGGEGVLVDMGSVIAQIVA